MTRLSSKFLKFQGSHFYDFSNSHFVCSIYMYSRPTSYRTATRTRLCYLLMERDTSSDLILAHKKRK
jgi:hypothetical protein